MDSHRIDESFLVQKGYSLVMNIFENLHKSMVSTLQQQQFYCMDTLDKFKAKAYGLITFRCAIGDGWLIGTAKAMELGETRRGHE